MALTNFAALDTPAKTVWSRDVWKQARDNSVIGKFMGTSNNSMIHRITELTKSERGDNAIVTLVPDMKEDGITGDNEIGNDTVALTAHQDKVYIDQLRQAIANTGRLNDQKSVVNFREQCKDQLSYWLADRIDQLAFLTLAGLDYGVNIDGSARADQGAGAGNNLSTLAFNTPLAATEGRNVTVKSDGTLDLTGATNSIVASDTLKYKHIVRLNTVTRTRYMRGVRTKDGMQVFHLFIAPQALEHLKLDDDFIQNARHADARGDGNMLFTGGESYFVDGLYIHSSRYVPTNEGASDGSRFGSGGTVNGSYGLLCGAQALGFIDLDAPIWDERDHFDFGNRYAIAYGKIFGMKKMQFRDAKKSTATEGLEDYGVIRVNMAI